VIEPFRVSTEAIRASVASLPDAGRRDPATALLALSQLVAVQGALGEQFDESAVEAFGQGAVLLTYRAARAEQRNKLWRWAEVARWFTSRLGETVPGAPDAALSAVNGLLQARSALLQLDAIDRDTILAPQPAVPSRLLELAAAVGAAEVKTGDP
jgi:hypothetical protein